MSTSLAKQLQAQNRQQQTGTHKSSIGTQQSIKLYKSTPLSLIYTTSEYNTINYTTYYLLANNVLQKLDVDALNSYQSLLHSTAVQPYDVQSLTTTQYNQLKLKIRNLLVLLNEYICVEPDIIYIYEYLVQHYKLHQYFTDLCVEYIVLLQYNNPTLIYKFIELCKPYVNRKYQFILQCDIKYMLPVIVNRIYSDESLYAHYIAALDKSIELLHRSDLYIYNTVIQLNIKLIQTRKLSRNTYQSMYLFIVRCMNTNNNPSLYTTALTLCIVLCYSKNVVYMKSEQYSSKLIQLLLNQYQQYYTTNNNILHTVVLTLNELSKVNGVPYSPSTTSTINNMCRPLFHEIDLCVVQNYDMKPLIELLFVSSCISVEYTSILQSVLQSTITIRHKTIDIGMTQLIQCHQLSDHSMDQLRCIVQLYSTDTRYSQIIHHTMTKLSQNNKYSHVVKQIYSLDQRGVNALSAIKQSQQVHRLYNTDELIQNINKLYHTSTTSANQLVKNESTTLLCQLITQQLSDHTNDMKLIRYIMKLDSLYDIMNIQQLNTLLSQLLYQFTNTTSLTSEHYATVHSIVKQFINQPGLTELYYTTGIYQYVVVMLHGLHGDTVQYNEFRGKFIELISSCKYYNCDIVQFNTMILYCMNHHDIMHTIIQYSNDMRHTQLLYTLNTILYHIIQHKSMDTIITTLLQSTHQYNIIHHNTDQPIHQLFTDIIAYCIKSKLLETDHTNYNMLYTSVIKYYPQHITSFIQQYYPASSPLHGINEFIIHTVVQCSSIYDELLAVRTIQLLHTLIQSNQSSFHQSIYCTLYMGILYLLHHHTDNTRHQLYQFIQLLSDRSNNDFHSIYRLIVQYKTELCQDTNYLRALLAKHNHIQPHSESMLVQLFLHPYSQSFIQCILQYVDINIIPDHIIEQYITDDTISPTTKSLLISHIDTIQSESMITWLLQYGHTLPNDSTQWINRIRLNDMSLRDQKSIIDLFIQHSYIQYIQQINITNELLVHIMERLDYNETVLEIIVNNINNIQYGTNSITHLLYTHLDEFITNNNYYSFNLILSILIQLCAVQEGRAAVVNDTQCNQLYGIIIQLNNYECSVKFIELLCNVQHTSKFISSHIDSLITHLFAYIAIYDSYKLNVLLQHLVQLYTVHTSIIIPQFNTIHSTLLHSIQHHTSSVQCHILYTLTNVLSHGTGAGTDNNPMNGMQLCTDWLIGSNQQWTLLIDTYNQYTAEQQCNNILYIIQHDSTYNIQLLTQYMTDQRFSTMLVVQCDVLIQPLANVYSQLLLVPDHEILCHTVTSNISLHCYVAIWCQLYHSVTATMDIQLQLMNSIVQQLNGSHIMEHSIELVVLLTELCNTLHQHVVNHEQHTNTQLLQYTLLSIDCVLNKLNQTDSSIKDLLDQLLIDLIMLYTTNNNNHHNIHTSIILLYTSLIHQLDELILPHLPVLVQHLLQSIAISHNHTAAAAATTELTQLQYASIQCIELLLTKQSLTSYMNTYIHELIQSITLLPFNGTSTILQSLSTLQCNTVIQSIITQYTAVHHYVNHIQLVQLLQLLQYTCRHMTRQHIKLHYKQITKFLLNIVLMTRVNYYTVLDDGVMNRVESIGLDCVVICLYQLNEQQLKSIYFRCIDLYTASNIQLTQQSNELIPYIVLVKITNILLDKFKSIFIGYIDYIYDSICNLLQLPSSVDSNYNDGMSSTDDSDTESQHTNKKRKLAPNNQNAAVPNPIYIELTQLLCHTIQSSIQVDIPGNTTEFYNNISKYELLLPAVIQLTQSLSTQYNLVDYKQYIQQYIVPTLIALIQRHTSYGINCIRPLTIELLSLTRHNNSTVRYIALYIYNELLHEFGSQMLIVLSDVLSYINESMDDMDHKNVKLVHRIVQYIEKLTGQSMDSMLSV